MIEEKRIRVAEKIKEHFKKQGITQQQIAQKLGITQATVSALMRGKPFGSKTAIDWSEAFGFQINWLITGEGEMFETKHDKELTLAPDHAEPNINDQLLLTPKNEDEMSLEVFKNLIEVIERRDKFLEKQQSDFTEQLSKLTALIVNKEEMTAKMQADHTEQVNKLISLLEKATGSTDGSSVSPTPKKRKADLENRP